MLSSKHLATLKTHQNIVSLLTAEKFKTYTFGENETVTKTMEAMRLYYSYRSTQCINITTDK